MLTSIDFPSLFHDQKLKIHDLLAQHIFHSDLLLQMHTGCFSLKDVREKYFTCSSLKELFEKVDATTIMDFSKEVSFYHLV